MSGKSLTLFGVGDIGPIHEPMDQYTTLVRDTLKTADLRFAQVERVYSKLGAFQLHSGGAHSRVDPKLASVFTDCGIDVASVASNHAMDWGPEALLDSIAKLRAMGIATVGAGANLEEARKPVFIEKNGIRLAFLAYCSVLREGYTAGPNKPGVAPLRAHTYYETFDYQAGVHPKVVTVPFEEDLRNVVADIAAAKKSADAVVVSLHWGVHFIRKVVADYQRVAMNAIFDAGASLILGHHAHVPKAIESNKGRVCFYSMSNFIMSATEKTGHQAQQFTERYGAELDPDYPRLPYGADGKRSMMVKAVFGASGVEKTSFLPVLIDKQLRPEILKHGDARFDDAVRYMEWVSEGFPHKFSVEGDEVVVRDATA